MFRMVKAVIVSTAVLGGSLLSGNSTAQAGGWGISFYNGSPGYYGGYSPGYYGGGYGSYYGSYGPSYYRSYYPSYYGGYGRSYYGGHHHHHHCR